VLALLRNPARNAMWMIPHDTHPMNPDNWTGPA